MRRLLCLLGGLLVSAAGLHATADEIPAGWKTHSPRPEIRPEFAYHATGGLSKTGSFVIEADAREGLFGWWEHTVEVQGGQYYRFSALSKASNIKVPRRTAVVRILWRDEDGRPVLHDKPTFASYRPGDRPRSRGGNR